MEVATHQIGEQVATSMTGRRGRGADLRRREIRTQDFAPCNA